MSKEKLHVPHPPARPGQRADFSYMKLAPAGALPKPDPLVPVEQTVAMASSLVRVLDDQGKALGPWDPQLSPQDLLTGMRHMLVNRALDERMVRAQRQGKISFYMQAKGEEAVAVAQAMALRRTDMIFPSYRTHAMHLVRGRDVVELMCQCLSNTRDMCKGRQMPVMYHWREGNIFSVSGNLATQLPQAVGWAMASAIKGEDRIAAAWTGEGATAEADFHHALTFAAVYRAPVVLNVVNNQWAISTFQGVAGGEQQTFAARGPGYGIAGLRVDGNDFLAAYAATQWAAERARRGGGATLIELVTYRGGAHSTSDDPSRYRPKDEWSAFPLGDPVERLHKHLRTAGIGTDADVSEMEKQAEQTVTQAWTKALSFGSLTDGPRLDPLSMFDDIYKSPTPEIARQRAQFIALTTKE